MRPKSSSAIFSSSDYSSIVSERISMIKKSYSVSKSKTLVGKMKIAKNLLPRKFNRCQTRSIPTSKLLERMQNYLSDHKKKLEVLSPVNQTCLHLKKPKNNNHPKFSRVKLQGRENQSYNFNVVTESEDRCRRMNRLLKRTYKDQDNESTSKEIKSGQRKNFKILLEAIVKYKKTTGMISSKIEEEFSNMEVKSMKGCLNTENNSKIYGKK